LFRRLFLILSCVFAALGSQIAWAQSTYGLSDLGNFIPTGMNSDGFICGSLNGQAAIQFLGQNYVIGPPNSSFVAISDSGWVAANAMVGGQNHACRFNIYSGNPIQDLGLPSGGLTSTAYCVNESGLVGGQVTILLSASPFVTVDAMEWSAPSSMFDLHPHGGYTFTSCFGLGPKTAVPVGWAKSTNQVAFKFVPSSGNGYSPGTLGGAQSQFYAVNDAGLAIGASQIADGHWHAVLCNLATNGPLVDLTAPTGGNSYGFSIDADGTGVGTADSGDASSRRGVIFNRSLGLIDLNLLIEGGSALTITQANNIHNQFIVGVATAPDGSQHGVLLTPTPPFVIAQNVDNVVGGSTKTVNLSITIRNTAGAGGATVALTSSNPSALTIPSQVTIPKGRSTITVPVTTLAVNADTSVQVTAMYQGVSQSTSLLVRPFVPTISVSPTNVSGGSDAQCTVTLNAAPSTDKTVSISSSSNIAQVPSSVLIPAKTQKVTFPITTSPVSFGQVAAITARLGSFAGSTQLTVQPALSSMSVNRTITYGSGTVDATLVLPAVAPAEGLTVTITGTACTVPATVVVPAGKKSAKFTVIADDVTSPTTATITASGGVVTVRASFVVNPLDVTALSVTPNTVVGGDGTEVIGKLTVPVILGVDTSFDISSNSTDATTPATVVIHAGSNSTTFSTGHSVVKKTVRATIAASHGGGIGKSAVVTIKRS